MEAMIDKFGRVVIPKIVREHLGLKPGMILEIEEQDHEVLLKPTTQHIIKNKGGVLVFVGEAIGNLEEGIQKIREERLKKIGKTK
jgi:AbrB family looped-hinge helix DNA binding protein